MAESSTNMSLEINKNLMFNNMTQVDETKRKRGRPSKPTKVQKDLTKLNEIPISGKLNEFYKDYVVSLYKQRKITRYNAAENIIKSLTTNITKSAKIFQNTLKKYETKVGVKERRNKAKEEQTLRKVDRILGKRQKLSDEQFIINVLLYRVPTPDEDETKEQYEARKRKMKLYQKTYQQVAALSLNVEADEAILKQCLNKLVEREPILTDATTKALFEQMLLIIRTNDKFNKPDKKS